MKIKRSEVLKLDVAFSELLEVRLAPNAAFKVATNGILANELAEKIRKTYKPVEGHKDYVTKRQEILSKFKKGADGSVEVPTEKAQKVSEKLEELDTEFTLVLQAQSDYNDKFNELLDVEADIKFEKIKMDELMVDGIEPAKLKPLIQSGIISNGSDA